MTETAKTATLSPGIEGMAGVGAQYGYSRTRRHPSVAPHILGAKNRTEIINLEHTATQLEAAKKFAEMLGMTGKTLLLVGGKAEARHAIRAAGENQDLPWSAGRWIGGALTNFSEIKKRMNRLTSLREDRERGALQKYTKKERLMIDREIAKLEQSFEGLLPLKGRLPDALFIVDIKEEVSALNEAKRMHVPVIGLAGSDCDMTLATYPILANDSSRKSIEYFVKEIVRAYTDGRKGAKKAE